MIMIRISRVIPNPSNCGLSYINYNSWTGDEMTMCGHNFCHYPVADRNEKCQIIPTYEETVAYENPWNDSTIWFCNWGLSHSETCPMAKGGECPYFKQDDFNRIVDAFNAIPEISYPIRAQER